MSDTTPGGTPPQNPYGQPPPAPQNPDAPPVGGENPYGQAPFAPQPPPTDPHAPADPYGQPPVADPYGQPPVANPYGQPPVANAYGQEPGAGAYASPYGAPPPGPLGDGLDMYGRPMGNDTRPGSVTAAGWITLIFAGLNFLLFGVITLAMIVAKDDVLKAIDDELRRQGTTTQEFTAESAFGVVVAVLLVFVIWCLIACALAVFTLRRSNGARITLVVSAVVAGLLSLLGIGSVVTAVPLLACLAVVILLFTGGAGDWFARRRRF